MRPLHFFGTRKQGINFSTETNRWRYGMGNVFIPPILDKEEKENALKNQVAILQHYQWLTHEAILLRSQYKKGIQVIDSQFLQHNSSSKNENGFLVIDADGLFSTLPNIPLLNVSGDAHALIFESSLAVGILVGSWRCIEKEIIEYMMQHFSNQGINSSDITLRVGPGLGSSDYSIGKYIQQEINGKKEQIDIYEKFRSLYGDKINPVFALKRDENHNIKLSKKLGTEKYVVDFPGLIQIIADHFQIGKVLLDESVNTFGKDQWKPVKEKAKRLMSENKVEEARHLLKNFYSTQPYFSARLFTRVERLIDPEQKPDSYSRTGRCLNGVMLA